MADAAIMYCIVKYMFFVMFHYVCFMCVCVCVCAAYGCGAK